MAKGTNLSASGSIPEYGRVITRRQDVFAIFGENTSTETIQVTQLEYDICARLAGDSIGNRLGRCLRFLLSGRARRIHFAWRILILFPWRFVRLFVRSLDHGRF